MTRFITILAAVLLSSGWLISTKAKEAFGEESVSKVRALSDHGELVLSDSRRVCLDGIWLHGFKRASHRAEALRQAVLDVVHGQADRFSFDETATFDRYGCQVALFQTIDGLPLQQELLRLGLAVVRPGSSLASSEHIDHWLALEKSARQAKLGIWQDRTSEPLQANAVDEHIGATSLVEGEVVRASSNDRYVYLNFGEDWRTDFTVRIRQKLIRGSDLEPDWFDGKMIRVRGFVQQSRGPLIDISHLKQIEIIP